MAILVEKHAKLQKVAASFEHMKILSVTPIVKFGAFGNGKSVAVGAGKPHFSCEGLAIGS